MTDEIDKNKLVADLCEKLLQEIEENILTLEQALYKGLRIARLVNDLPVQKWIRLELAGYYKDRLPTGITIADAEIAAHLGNRYTKSIDPKSKDEQWSYAVESIPVMEATIASKKLALQQTTMPSQVNPIQSGYTTETYASVFTTVTRRQNDLNEIIKENQSYVARCRSSLYSIIFTKYHKYRFDSVTESAFLEVKKQVDAELAIILPDSLQQFNAAYDRLGSANPTEISQALSTCRNILYAYADYVYPPSSKPYKATDGTILDVKADKHKNRILAFLDTNLTSANNVTRLTRARAEELFGRISHLHDLQSQGTKTIIEVKEARLGVIDTYLLLGQLIDYIPASPNASPQSSTTPLKTDEAPKKLPPKPKIKKPSTK